MSGKHLNDISKVYLDTIANVKKAETDADIKRWEDLGGPTPGNYRADDNSAKLKEGRRLRKSDWRQELKEVIDKPETEEKAEKKVDEKKGIKNKVVINPTFKEAIEEIGGELLEVNEVDSVQKTQDDTQKKQEQHKKQLEQKQKKVAAMKKLVLRKKMQAVGAGAGEDITAGYEPEGDQLDERLGGKGYKPYTSLTGKKVSGDWEDSDRGAGNKAKKRAGGKVEKKSPTYLAHVHNKEGYESKKTGEVLAAFKRDPKVRKRFEKAARKDKGPGSVENQAADDMLRTAKDTAKRKGDTSKSDDRYAYEEVVHEATRYKKEKGYDKGGTKKPSGKKDAALSAVVSMIRSKHGKGAIVGQGSRQQKKVKGAKSTAGTGKYKRAADEKKQLKKDAKEMGYGSDTKGYIETRARYGSKENMKSGRGLGT